MLFVSVKLTTASLLCATSSKLAFSYLYDILTFTSRWFFFLIHQSWFLVVPLMLIIGDPTVEIDSGKLSIVTTKLKKIYSEKL
jgi:hypothetical protein